MPAKSPEALARRRARQRERWLTDPAWREARNARRRSGKPRPPRKPKFRRRFDAPFVGCDGEGTTDPKTGEHRYCLFRMGDRELYDGGRRLETPELLQFIIDHPNPRDYLVGFYFDYDNNSILRDVERERDPARPKIKSRLERILAIEIANAQQIDNPHQGATWTWLNYDGYREFGVMWLTKNHLRVCHSMPDPKRPGRSKSDPATRRTIYDVGENFQGSFVSALELWGVGAPAVVADIAATKAKRDSFAAITDEIRAYNKLECELLAELMEKFRAAAVAVNIVPKEWSGAGKLGSALLEKHDILKRAEYETLVPPALRQMAKDSYYGPRFEVTRTGLVRQPVNALDINSAFPAAMLKLPCLRHGRFHKASAETLQSAPRDALFLCPVRFHHPASTFICGLPIRSLKGPISWPREGAGLYWSTEIRSAKRLGARCELMSGWLYEKRCNCQPFDWVSSVYAERLKLDKLGQGRGVPLKLALNSVYGKFGQRVGAKTYTNFVYASLITATVRAQLNDAVRTAGPRNVVMIASDSIFTVNRRPKVKISASELGAWKAERYADLFVVQPGLYWPSYAKASEGKPRKLRTRGISRKFFEPHVGVFEEVWSDYALELLTSGHRRRPPIIKVPLRAFISLKQAWRLSAPQRKPKPDSEDEARAKAKAQKALAKGATWQPFTRQISFGWMTKRIFERLSRDGQAAELGSMPGDRNAWSATYSDQGRRMAVELGDDGEPVTRGELLPSDLKALLEAMPDPIDFGPPFTDE